MSQNSNNNAARRPFTFDRVVRMLLTMAAILACIWFIDYLSDVLLPFLVAWLIAYMLEPLVQYNRRFFKWKGRKLAVFFTLFEVTVGLSLVAFFLFPNIFAEMHRLAQLIHEYASGNNSADFIPAAVHNYLRHNIDFNFISSELTRQDWQSIINAASKALSSGVYFILGIFSWFIVLLYVVFIMLDYEKLVSGFKRLVPPRYRSTVFSVFNDVKSSMNHYFRGQALIATIVGVLFAIGFLIVGLPMAVVLGLFIGLLNMVPYLQLISLIPTTILCLICAVDSGTGFWTLWWECMAVYIVVQCIQDLYLTPKILGKAMGLNPAIILLSLSVWGTLLGFIGLIVALPLTTLLISYYNKFIARRGYAG